MYSLLRSFAIFSLCYKNSFTISHNGIKKIPSIKFFNLFLKFKGMCEMVIVNEEAENEKTRQRRRLMGGRFLQERY